MHRNVFVFLGRVFIPLSFLVLSVTSCEESSFIGLEVQPGSDRFSIRSVTDSTIRSSVYKRDSILAINHSRSLLGVFDDPLFGRSMASFITQVGILADIDFGTDPVADSLVLYLRVSGAYGRKTDAQEVRVYEVSEIVDYQTGYYSNLDPEELIYGSALLASHIISPAQDDTLIAVPLTGSDFTEKLLFAPDSATQSLGDFIQYIRGLYVTAGLAGETGALFTINLDHDASGLSLYYRNSDHPDSTFRYDYVINEGANRINLFDYDYSTAVFADEIGVQGTGREVFYVQGGSGILGRLDLENLHAWQDSMPVSINSARLILPADEDDPTAADFPLPAWLTLFEKDDNGNLMGIIDLSLGDEFLGGTYNTELKRYSFNITNFLQAYVKGKRQGTIFVGVRQAGTNHSRAVLRNFNHPSGGPRLEITYTKH